MKRRLVLLGVYFIFAPIFVLSLVIYQLFLHNQNSQVSGRVLGAHTSTVEYQSIPHQVSNTRVALSSREGRVEVLREFFSRYDSPLEEYAENIVDAADKYDLDYRLVPAIAMQESTLCLKAPKGLNNCWGFGIYGKKKTAFDSYAQAIDVVSKTLSEEYHGKGLVEPDQIMSKYTPSNNGEWAENVTYVMDRIASAM